jgi:hypothetical protein
MHSYTVVFVPQIGRIKLKLVFVQQIGRTKMHSYKVVFVQQISRTNARVQSSVRAENLLTWRPSRWKKVVSSSESGKLAQSR